MFYCKYNREMVSCIQQCGTTSVCDCEQTKKVQKKEPEFEKPYQTSIYELAMNYLARGVDPGKLAETLRSIADIVQPRK